ncbi:ABC transporter ATP-binding protein [Patulibacter americanus]|uniref:ABC transporter ATP-binding protein n=1 Tax=Patulibacter americanus TaxID=588672 RepID=UPI0003B5595D|nr:betaine/proline/choline family ABC transporter ATP-binding protein [Patulibacter americanus]
MTRTTKPDDGGPTATPAASLRFDAVQKRYPGNARPTIESLSIEVPAGEICVLVGPSGCGKTTAMRMVNRLIEPTAGQILIDGRPNTERAPADLRREIGYVIQQTGLFPHRTIAQNVATVPKLLGWSTDRIAARTTELLELVGLDPEFADRYPAQLSGGQRQRVGVARALAVDPPLMLMDEPFGAIDPITRERLQNEFLRLQAQVRRTIVFVTHDIDEAIKMGDRIAVMRPGGRLAQYATPAELLLSPADEFVEQFVGADRALKRLALGRVRDLELEEPTRVRYGDPVAGVREALRRAEVPYPLVIDADGRPLAWLDDDDLHGERIADGIGSEVAVVDRDDILRDAFSDVLQHRVQYAAVTDHRGVVIGILSADAVARELAPPGPAPVQPAEAHHGTGA